MPAGPDRGGKAPLRRALPFFSIYAVIYMGFAVYNTFLSVYFKGLDFSDIQIGVLMAAGPFLAMVGQPFWGMVADRSPSKNAVVVALFAGNLAAALLLPLSGAFAYSLALVAVFAFFQTSINPINDSMALESLQGTGRKFGHIRMAGTLGFAFMSVIVGRIAEVEIKYIFVAYALIMVAAAAISWLALPRIRGHQSGGRRMGISVLLRDRRLMTLISFNFVMQVTLGYYYSFYPIYLSEDLGGGKALLGLGMLITATSEVPFLLFSDRIVSRLSVQGTMTVSASVMAMRWVLMFLVTDKYLVMAINTLHGFSFIVFMFCLATYINSNVPVELRASGQTLNGLFANGLARIVASVGGGALLSVFGKRQLFLGTAVIAIAAIAAYGRVFRSWRRADANI
ncbi:MAG: MFS transporter [Oscillospiraceae bacterium]|nr:MFS transporter [Oscillospiraceae bacterium]